jgi:hypothetical protein
MQQIAHAMHSHQEHMGRLPTDILDRQGRPLLSWRVQLLPFLEQDQLFWRFRRDEPWDSPHNRQLIAEIPRVYHDPMNGLDGATRYLQPRGDDTIFLRGPPWLNPRMPADLGAKILVVEVDDDHGVIWTRPKDLDYDPDNPREGLARRWKIRLWREKAGMVALADGDVRFVWSQTSPEFLHARFSASAPEPTTKSLTLWDIVSRPPFNELAVPFLLLSLVALAGSARVVYRLARKRPCSPGEFLWLIVGAACAVLLSFFLSCFSFEEAPAVSGKHVSGSGWLWIAPRLAALLVSVLALVSSWRSLAWRFLFAGLAVCLALESLGARNAGPWGLAEEALVTGSAPLTLGLAGLVGVLITLFQFRQPDSGARNWAHWAGIVVAMLPLVFCAVWSVDGRVDPWPGNPVVRIRE